MLREQRRGEKSLCENTVSKSLHAQQNPAEAQEEKLQTQSAEPPRSVDDSTLKSRSKRESRRQRELQQASFSLELLKVRCGSVDDAPIPRPSDSQESFEILEDPAASEPEQNQSSLASFYIAEDDGSPVKQAREKKKEAVVVIIRMQKEIPVDRSSREALQKHETMEIHGETDDTPNGSSSPDRPEPQTITSSSSSKPLQLDSRDSAREQTEVQEKSVSQSISVKEKAFAPKRSRLTFSKWVHACVCSCSDPMRWRSDMFRGCDAVCCVSQVR